MYTCVITNAIAMLLTERHDLQGEEGLKSLAAQTAGAIEPIFGLVILQRHRTGVTVAIFEFPSGTPNKLILCCSLPDVIPLIEFHPNRRKNTEV